MDIITLSCTLDGVNSQKCPSVSTEFRQKTDRCADINTH